MCLPGARPSHQARFLRIYQGRGGDDSVRARGYSDTNGLSRRAAARRQRSLSCRNADWHDAGRHERLGGGIAMASVQLTVNGQARQLEIDPRQSLLDALREHLDLTGTKKGCDHGQCGACTVLVDGRRVVSCLTLAVMKDGAQRHDDRRAGEGWHASSVAAGVHRSRRLPVRLLHAGPDLFGRRPDRRRQGQDRRRNPRADERQHLPLRRVSQHRGRGDPAGDGGSR